MLLLKEFGGWLVEHLWRLSVELAILAAVVLVVIHLLRVRSPRLRDLFWCLVLAKPVVTLLVASPLSLYWFLRPVQPEPPAPAPRAVRYVRPRPAYRRPVVPIRPYRRRPIIAAETKAPPWWHALETQGILAAVWSVVAFLLGLRLVIGFAFVSFLRRTAVLQRDGPLADLVEESARRLAVRQRVRVAVSQVAHGPVLAGAFRPVVLLPRRLIRELSPRQLGHVIAHEMAHARRFDNALLLLQRLAEMLLFLHPVVWLCGWAMRKQAEAACDDAVIAAYGNSTAYADSLTRVAETTRGVRNLITRRLLVNTFAAAESNFAGRVRRILGRRVGRATVGLSLAAVAALVGLAIFGLPTAAEHTEEPEDMEKDKTVNAGTDFEYGFRHDPMKFVEESDALEAALARGLVFGEPRQGDEEVVGQRLGEILAEQREDGSFGDTAKETGNGLFRLAALGLGGERPEVRRCCEAMLRQVRAGKIGGNGYEPEHGLVPVNGLRAACMLGLTDEPEVRRTLRWLAENPDVWTEETCPWGATFVLQALWHARGIENAGAGLEAGLRVVADCLNDAGCVKYWDPYAVVGAVGVIDRPDARAILLRQVPMILRGQNEDGGWGENPEALPTLGVLRALKTHDLLDSLRELPPLPPDWQVVHSTPAPAGNLGTMTWLDGRLWVLNWEAGQILALSAEDGSVAHRLPFPEGGAAGVGRWGDSLAVTQGKPHKRLLKVGPESGAVQRKVPLGFMEMIMSATEVDGRLWVADGWLFPGNVVNPDDPATYAGQDAYDLPRLEPLLAGTCPNGFAAAPDGVWHTDYFARVMIKSGPDGKLLDWAERPFGWTSGIAWDGENLWAVDNAGGRICQIQKTETAPEVEREETRTAASSGNRAGKGETKTAPDYSKLELNGNGHEQDTFSLTVQAAARMLGLEAHYGDIYALSSNAFSPAINLREDCTAWWHVEGYLGDRAMDIVAGRLGLRAERLDLPVHDLSGSDTKDEFNTKALRHRRACASTLRKTMDRGAVVITDGGWRARTEQEPGFAPWCWWGVITRADEDGTIAGACLGANPGRTDGYTEHPLDFVGHCWALYPDAPSLSEPEAVLAALANAVARVRGGNSFAAGKEHAYGLQAMDAWIARMQAIPVCTACFDTEPEGVWTCALNNGQTTTAASRAAAAWLRRKAAELSEDARTRCEAAAAHYERIVDLLAPAMDWNGAGHYRHFIGNREKQQAHADRVLAEVKTELAAAADEMEAALRAEGIEPAPAVTSRPGEVPPAEEIVLNGRSYTLEWISPEGLGSAKLNLTGTCELRADGSGLPAIYAEHVDPLYNIHCELTGPETAPADAERWADYWRRLAEGLSGKVPCFAVAAYCDGKLAGQMRFFPGDLARLRTGPQGFADPRDDGTLLVGAGVVDLLGTRDGLDGALLRRVVNYARGAGYARIRAIAWSNVRPYAMWGESLPVAAYEDAGFARVQGLETPDPAALSDMLTGSHEPDMQRLTQRALAAHPWALVLVGDRVPEMDRREADLQALRHALALGRDEVTFSHGWVTGQEGFVLWATVLRDTERPGQARWHANVLRHLRLNRQSAVRYLRAMAGRHEEETARHIRAAADVYERVLDELAQPVAGWEALKDVEKRDELADLAERIAALERGAVDELAAALEAAAVELESGSTDADATPAGGEVRIEGVPTMSWGESSDTTFAGAMEAALAVTDHPYTATHIMGYSGLAFRVRWTSDGAENGKGWCPSIPVGEFPEEQAAVVRATGWRFDVIDEMANEEDPRMGRYADRIAAAIDSGRPVVGYPAVDDLNAAVACGYRGQGDGREFLWRTYWSGAEAKAVPADRVGPWVMIPVEFGEEPEPRRRLLDALSIAVRNWHRPGSESPTGYRYAWGERALQAWLEDLRQAGDFTRDQQKGLFFANWWNYEIWQDARARAAAFLNDEADHLEGDAREAVLRAADIYREEAERLRAELGKGQAFLGLSPGKGFQDWTTEVREREQRIIAELRRALEAEGIDPPAFATARTEGGEVRIDGLERWPSCMTEPGGFVASSQYLGLGHSPEWVYGGTGFAFALNVHRTLCPSGPTAWPTEQCHRLAGNLGLQVEPILAFKNSPDFAEKQESAFETVKEAIDEGLPVVGWEMDVPDYYVVCGYDEEGNYLFRDFDGSVRRVHHTRLGDTGIATLQLLIVRHGEPADDRRTVREAIEFALELGAGNHGHGGVYAAGLAGYHRWITALEEPEDMLEDEVAGFGLAYNAQCWAECRRHAGPFLEEAKRCLNDEQLAADFNRAIERYRRVADRLDEVEELFPCNPAEDVQMAGRLAEADRRCRAVAALRTARAAESEGMEALRRIAVALGAGTGKVASETEDG